MGEVVGPIDINDWSLLKTMMGPKGTIAWSKKQDSRNYAATIEIEERLCRKILHSGI